MHRLATLVQISDLHFREDPTTPLSKTLNRVVHKIPWLDGIWGHDPALLQAVEKTWKSLKAEKPILIVTGDLTQMGGAAQFDAADQWLGTPRNPLAPALDVKNWKEYSIPGNHDQWPERPPLMIFGPPGMSHFRRYFADDCYEFPPVDLGRGHVLKILGVNTDAGIPGHPAGLYERALAHGSFASALDRLAQRLKQRQPKELRVLALHHSPTLSRTRMILRIDSASHTRLNDFLRQAEVSLMLSGHTHAYGFPKWNGATQAPLGTDLTEVTCGTTTQVTRTSPWHAKQLGAKKRLSDENGLMVHRITEDRGNMEWRAEWWRYTPSSGMFERPAVGTTACKQHLGPYR